MSPLELAHGAAGLAGAAAILLGASLCSAACLGERTASVAPQVPSVGSVEDLNYDRLRLMDVSPCGDFMFRGNQPQVTNPNGTVQFAYDTLVGYMEEYLNNVSPLLKLPEHFRLVDVSFLDPGIGGGEAAALALERSFFGANPSLGSLLHWPLVGDAASPFNGTYAHDPAARAQHARHLNSWQVDRLPELVAVARSMLFGDGVDPAASGDCYEGGGAADEGRRDAPPTPRVVLYLHCGHGQDRTGEFAGSYELAYGQNVTWTSVWRTNKEIGMDVPANVNALEWFCQYATDVLGITGLGCTPAH